MGAYTSLVYPAALGAAAVLLLAAAAAFAWPRFASALAGASWLTRVVTVLEVLAIGVLAITGRSRPGVLILVGYLVSAVAVLGFLGISRVGGPPAPGAPADPDRPVLSPRQAAKVDAVAATIVAVALAVVAWRLHSIVLGGAPS